ncbi:MAG: hypothetical protein WHX52_18170 [Anaerolineae bacterium]
MSNDMPDWLAGLVSAPENEDEDQLLTAAVTQPQARSVQPQIAAPQPQASAGVFEAEELMADLRSQVAAQEPAASTATRRRRSRYAFGMLPQQIFFLSVLMFLDVAVIGLLFLVMLGRIVLPF